MKFMIFLKVSICLSLKETQKVMKIKQKRFLRYIDYKQEAHTKSKRAKVIKRLAISIASARRDFTFDKILYDKTGETESKTSNRMNAIDPNNLIKRQETLILETKAGPDGLYDEMLKIYKQLLSMNNISHEQLDKFIFIITNQQSSRPADEITHNYVDQGACFADE